MISAPNHSPSHRWPAVAAIFLLMLSWIAVPSDGMAQMTSLREITLSAPRFVNYVNAATPTSDGVYVLLRTYLDADTIIQQAVERYTADDVVMWTTRLAKVNASILHEITLSVSDQNILIFGLRDVPYNQILGDRVTEIQIFNLDGDFTRRDIRPVFFRSAGVFAVSERASGDRLLVSVVNNRPVIIELTPSGRLRRERMLSVTQRVTRAKFIGNDLYVLGERSLIMYDTMNYEVTDRHDFSSLYNVRGASPRRFAAGNLPYLAYSVNDTLFNLNIRHGFSTRSPLKILLPTTGARLLMSVHDGQRPLYLVNSSSHEIQLLDTLGNLLLDSALSHPIIRHIPDSRHISIGMLGKAIINPSSDMSSSYNNALIYTRIVQWKT